MNLTKDEHAKMKVIFEGESPATDDEKRELASKIEGVVADMSHLSPLETALVWAAALREAYGNEVAIEASATGEYVVRNGR